MISTSLVLVQIMVLIVSLFFLVKSSDIVSGSAVNISRITGLGEMAIGFLILSVITSLPELAVAISAVNSGDIGISVGGLFGSNVANIGLVLGLTAILAPSVVKITQKSFRNLSLMLVLSLVPILALFLTGLTSYLGFFLLFLFIAFCVYIIRNKVKVESDKTSVKGGLYRELLLVIAGVIVVLISAQFVVSSSVSISEFLGMEEAVMGATVIAVGTSLPELSVSLTAARKNHMNLALGNILGSCVTNLTLILGIVLALSTCVINAAIFTELIIILMIVNLALWRMLVDNKIGLFDGVVLIFLYLIFLVSTISVQTVVLNPEYLVIGVSSILDSLSLTFAYGIVAVAAVILAITLTKG